MLSIKQITRILINIMLMGLFCGLMSINVVHAKAVNQATDTQSEQLDPEKRQYFRYTKSGQKVYLGVVEYEFVVQFKEGATQEQIEDLNNQYQTQILRTFRKEGRTGSEATATIYLLRFPLKRRLKEMLKPYSREIREVSNVFGYEPIVEWTMPVFHILNTNVVLNARLIPTDEFTVMLSLNVSESELLQLNQAHRVEMLGQNAKGSSYRLRVTPKSDLHSLDMANLYHEQPFIA